MSSTRLNTIIENFSKYKRKFQFEDQFFEEMYSLYEKGKYQTILEKIDSFPTHNKDNFNLQILKFHVLIEHGKYNEVEALLEDFETKINLNDIYQKFQFIVAKTFLYLKQNKHEECNTLINALETLREDMVENPKDYLTMEALGNLYRIKGLLSSYIGPKRLTPDELLETHERGLEIFHKSNNLLGIARQHNNLGRIFITQYQNFDTGFVFLEQALAMRTYLGHEGEIAGSLNLLGINYSFYGEYDLALEYLTKAKELRLRMGNIDNIIISYLNLGHYYFSIGENEKTVEYCQKAKKLLDKNPNNFYEFALNIMLFVIYSKTKNLKKMIEYQQLLKDGSGVLGNPLLQDISVKLVGVIERHSKRVKKKANAIYTLEEFARTSPPTILNIFMITSFVIYEILDHLFEEFKESEEIEIIEEFDIWLDVLERINSDHRGVLEVAKAKLLKSKLLLLDFKIEEAKSLVKETRNEFEKREVYKFSVLFSNELEKLLTEEETWKRLRESNAPIGERIQLAQMDEIIETSSIQRVIKEIKTDRVSLFEQRKTESLLQNVLPKEIIPFLHNKNEPYIESFDSLSVLFADVVGFTKLSQRISPKQVVEALNEIFGYFDSLLEKYNAEKIRTIGDNYMLCIGAPRRCTNHAELICKLALEMLQYIENRKDNDFNFRIGINSGPAVGGVIGTTKYHFDVWGDMVNTASRMESTDQPGRIQITNDTYQIVKNKFIVERREKFEVKGKGMMETYFLVSEKEDY